MESVYNSLSVDNRRVIDHFLDICQSERFIKDRIIKIKLLGYEVKECAMGSGGVGQIKKVGDEIRVQIGYGHGKHNYAMCAIL